jgi:hypothetical protein
MPKEKVQPAASAAPAANPPGDGFRVNAAIDARLDKFMADNPEMTEHFTKLVKEYPERAIRSLALRSMFKQEDMARQIERQMPQVKQWVAEHPGLEQQIESKIRTTNPISRMAAFITEAIRAKGRIEFSPRPSTEPRIGTGVSG